MLKQTTVTDEDLREATETLNGLERFWAGVPGT